MRTQQEDIGPSDTAESFAIIVKESSVALWIGYPLRINVVDARQRSGGTWLNSDATLEWQGEGKCLSSRATETG
jgi:hypothetical protein